MNNLTRKWQILLIALWSICYQQIFAEGALRTYDCTMDLACDTDGNCERETGSVRFTMSPLSLQADGSGSFELQYDAVVTDMQALSEIGPFYWTDGQLRHTLLASSETRFVWHSLALAEEPVATTRFLQCTFHL